MSRREACAPATIAMPETAAEAQIADLPVVTFIWLNARDRVDTRHARGTGAKEAARVARAACDAQRSVIKRVAVAAQQHTAT